MDFGYSLRGLLAWIIHEGHAWPVILSAAKNLGELGAAEILRYAQDDVDE